MAFLAVDDGFGKPRVLTSPIQTGVPGRERPVANQVGVRRIDKAADLSGLPPRLSSPTNLGSVSGRDLFQQPASWPSGTAFENRYPCISRRP
jgi:hypothetical protein